jgi:hypothetical protein
MNIYIRIHIHNFSIYIKIHPYVIVEYLSDAINLVIIATIGCINQLMDENKCKINPTNKMVFLIVAS